MTREKEYYSGKIEGYSFVCCPNCQKKLRHVDLKHIKTHGYASVADFQDVYPESQLMCTELYTIRRQQALDISIPDKVRGGHMPHSRQLSERGRKRKQEAAKRQALEAFETLENGLKQEGLITVDEAIIISGRSKRALQRAAQNKRITATVEHSGAFKLIGLSASEILKQKK